MSTQINYKGFGILHFADRWPAYEVEFERISGCFSDSASSDDGWDGHGEYTTLKAARKTIDRYLKEVEA
jgi:hypothetical protein